MSVVGAGAKWWWVVQVGVSTAEPPHWPGQDRRLLQCPKEDGARAAPSGGAGAGVAVNLSERHLAPGTFGRYNTIISTVICSNETLPTVPFPSVKSVSKRGAVDHHRTLNEATAAVAR